MTDSGAPSPWQTRRYEIKVHLEPLDYVYYMQAIRWTMLERVVAWLPLFGAAFLGGFGGVVLSDLVAAQLPAVPYIDWGLVIILAGALLAMAVFKIFVMGPYIDSTFNGQPIGMDETTIIADERGITSTAAGVTLQAPWSKISAIVATEHHMYLMFTRLMGIIVPRRAFADEAEATRFADFVRAQAPAAA